MPNLNQILEFKSKFSQLNESDRFVKDFLEKKEAKEVLRKVFRNDNLNEDVSETRFYSFLNESLSVDKPDLIKYFEEGKEEDVALLFIDITSFSKTINSYDNAQIKKFLDEYYKVIIPIIYEHGGEIEKLMGDGIICVFGKPFLNLDNPEYVYKAEKCAEDVIKKFHGTDKNVKVAIHKGLVNYYKVPGEEYSEYTMIGQPITDLYRLESVSQSNAINFFHQSSYDKLGWSNSIFDTSIINWKEFEINKLQGVDYRKVRRMSFNGYE